MSNVDFQPIFTPNELEYNSKLKEELFKLVSSGDSILFVGSGLSMPVGFPSWDGLLKQLEALALKVGAGFAVDDDLRKNDPLAYADKVKKHFNDNSKIDRYNNELHNIFSGKKPNFKDFHKKLVKLPFPLILTTNYDTVLSDALHQVQIDDGGNAEPNLCFPVSNSTRPLVSKFLMALHNSLDFPKMVAHLHGYFSLQNEIVLTKADYEKCYNHFPIGTTQDELRPSLHFLILWSLMATRRIVFFGFGMKDPYLVRLLENVCSELWQWERPTHINIAPIESSTATDTKAYAEKLREEFGVDTFFYENNDQGHQQLVSLINELHESCFPAKTKISPLTNTTPQEDGARNQDVSGDGVSQWVLELNKKMNTGEQNENK